MARVDDAVRRIQLARAYSLDLIDHFGPDDWLRMPAGNVTHLAWQVGHLAVAEYNLCLARIRGRRTEDAEFMSEDFARRYGKGSVPEADPGNADSPEVLRATLERVHATALALLEGLADSELDQPPADGRTHPRFMTKGGALEWCADHEMMHAGQIGLLRRLLGHAPLR